MIPLIALLLILVPRPPAVSSWQPLVSRKHQQYAYHQPATTLTLRMAASSTESVDASSLLYQEHEKMLVARGKVEGQLMAHHTTPIEASVVKGAGVGGGFSTNQKSSSKQLKEEAKAHVKVLRKDGVVRIDNVLPNQLADDIRQFVFALRRDSEQAVKAGTVKPKDRFADVLLKENRCDLTMPLNDITGNALVALLQQSAVGETLRQLLGKEAVLYELSCLMSDPGSHRQVMHPDTPCTPAGEEQSVLYTCFVALQDVSLDMGPTTWMPGTHTLEAHDIFSNEQTKDALLEKGPAVLGLLPKGSCGIFDSRLLHCGGANVCDPQLSSSSSEDSNNQNQRAIFYVSFRNPKVAHAGNPGSIRPTLIHRWDLEGLHRELRKHIKGKSDVFVSE